MTKEAGVTNAERLSIGRSCGGCISNHVGTSALFRHWVFQYSHLFGMLVCGDDAYFSAVLKGGFWRCSGLLLGNWDESGTIPIS